MIEMLKRHEIQVLRRAGHTWSGGGGAERRVRADAPGAIAAEAAVTTVDNAAERAPSAGRPARRRRRRIATSSCRP